MGGRLIRDRRRRRQMVDVLMGAASRERWRDVEAAARWLALQDEAHAELRGVPTRMQPE